MGKTKTKTTDFVIRNALHAKRLWHAKECPDTIVVDELGLAHTKSRIDIAVIGEYIHGYEIKSDKDTLERFAAQMSIYKQTLHKLTVVAAPRHINEIMSCAPSWCGVLMVEQGPRGGIKFITVRKALRNPDVDPFMLAHLLWRDEVLDLLSRNGFAANELRCPKKQLYKLLCDSMTLHEIWYSIRNYMIKRKTWRALPIHMSYGG